MTDYLVSVKSYRYQELLTGYFIFTSHAPIGMKRKTKYVGQLPKTMPIISKVSLADYARRYTARLSLLIFHHSRWPYQNQIYLIQT